LDARLAEKRVGEFRAQLKARIELEEKSALEAASNGSLLTKERSDLQTQAGHIVDAIAKHGISAFLSSQLSTIEVRLAEIERLLATKPSPKVATISEDDMREFLCKESKDFCEVLVGDPEIAKREIQKRIKSLVLTPKPISNGTVLEVSSDVGLFRTEDVMVNNLRVKLLSITPPGPFHSSASS
jgi:hypothetical protein